jgi:hypothetical protein
VKTSGPCNRALATYAADGGHDFDPEGVNETRSTETELEIAVMPLTTREHAAPNDCVHADPVLGPKPFRRCRSSAGVRQLTLRHILLCSIDHRYAHRRREPRPAISVRGAETHG